MSIYPECSAWRHLFEYRGLSLLLLFPFPSPFPFSFWIGCQPVRRHSYLPNRPFPSSGCLCVKTSLRAKPFIWKCVSPICSFSCKSNSFSYEKFCTKTRFETEANQNSEMGYLSDFSKTSIVSSYILAQENNTINTEKSRSGVQRPLNYCGLLLPHNVNYKNVMLWFWIWF